MSSVVDICTIEQFREAAGWACGEVSVWYSTLPPTDPPSWLPPATAAAIVFLTLGILVMHR